MNDISRKKMNDMIVPHNEVIRRPSIAPEVPPGVMHDGEVGRIEKNPFFEKQRKEKDIPLQSVKRSRGKGLLWALLFVLLLAIGFIVADRFATATIEITPVMRSANIDTDITALKDETEGSLAFHFVSLADEKAKEIPATIEKMIQKKASGKVMIYNAYSADSQRLIKNTRLENPDHKIFRIDTSVVVPGAKVIGGKTVPGSVEALVYADVAGKEYNIGTTNFTIPGFKGDPRYTKFYASSKPDSPIGGGFSGTVKVPSDEAITQTQEELKQDLKKSAIEKARAQIPPQVTFFPGSVILKFEEVPQEFTTESTAKVSVHATVSVFFFDTAKLTQKLAETLPTEDQGKIFTISNMSELAFGPFSPLVDNVVFTDLQKIGFHIKGTAKFVGQVDERKIRAELVDKNKKDFGKIIADQKNVSKADAVVRPMWKSVFPSDISKITVNIVTK